MVLVCAELQLMGTMSFIEKRQPVKPLDTSVEES